MNQLFIKKLIDIFYGKFGEYKFSGFGSTKLMNEPIKMTQANHCQLETLLFVNGYVYNCFYKLSGIISRREIVWATIAFVARSKGSKDG